MTDIVERLRHRIHDAPMPTEFLLDEAADEIERLRRHAQCAPTDPLTDLVERFSKALLAKLRLAEANGRSGWDRDDWEKQCQEGLLRHVDKGDPRDVAAYCAFMWHHGWITALTSTERPDLTIGASIPVTGEASATADHD